MQQNTSKDTNTASIRRISSLSPKDSQNYYNRVVQIDRERDFQMKQMDEKIESMKRSHNSMDVHDSSPSKLYSTSFSYNSTSSTTVTNKPKWRSVSMKNSNLTKKSVESDNAQAHHMHLVCKVISSPQPVLEDFVRYENAISDEKTAMKIEKSQSTICIHLLEESEKDDGAALFNSSTDLTENFTESGETPAWLIKLQNLKQSRQEQRNRKENSESIAAKMSGCPTWKMQNDDKSRYFTKDVHYQPNQTNQLLRRKFYPSNRKKNL